MVLAALRHPLPRCTTCSSFLFDNDKFVACLPTSSMSAPPLVSWPPPQARHRWSAGLLYERITADLLVKPALASSSSLPARPHQASPPASNEHTSPPASSTTTPLSVSPTPSRARSALTSHAHHASDGSHIAREYGEQREH
jgi:hypothetical protein